MKTQRKENAAQTRTEFYACGLACFSGTPQPMPHYHWHNEIECNLLECGSMTYVFAGQRVVVPGGRLAIFWGATPHRLLDTEPGTICRWLTLPLVWFLQWNLPPRFAQSVLHGAILMEPDVTAAPSAPHDTALFAQWEQDVGSRTPERETIALLEIEARFRRLALAQTEPNALPETAFGTGRMNAAEGGNIERMAQYIAEHYAEALQVETIARAVGLHPNYAMTLFRRQSGLSLLDYLTRHRISHAQRLLVTTDATIAAVALESGFGSLSAFYTQFQKLCGVSPRAYRLAMQQAGE